MLVQGDAEPATEPDRAYLEETLRPQATRFMGPPKEGKLFWDRWLREYYQDRVPVAVDVERVTVWADDAVRRAARDHRRRRPPASRRAQDEPAKGTGPRVDAERAAARLRSLDHALLAYVGADGYPEVVPVADRGGGPGRHPPLVRAPAAARRAPGGHARRTPTAPKLIGLAARQHTGWLTVDEEGALYAPHTESGFRAPANKTALLLANGLLAKRGLRKARRAAATQAARVLPQGGRGIRLACRTADPDLSTIDGASPRARATGPENLRAEPDAGPGPVRGDQRRLRRSVRRRAWSRRAGRDADARAPRGAPS